MFNVQGKNVIVFGGLKGVGFALTKNILNKGCNKLYIIDVTENYNLIQELRSQYPSTKIDYERIDYWTPKAGQIQYAIQNVVMKAQHIDLVINCLELTMQKDLQRTIDMNLKLYLNITTLCRDAMDRSKGGRGGCIVNVLNHLGYETSEYGYDVQQYLINKQVLLSLNKALCDEFYYQQTGVAVLSVLPVVNQKTLFKKMDWIKEIGLQHLVIDMNSIHGHEQNRHHGHHEHKDFSDFDFLGGFKDHENYGYKQLKDFDDQDYYKKETYGHYSRDSTYGQRYNYGGDYRKVLDQLCFNILRCIERCQNGYICVVGLEGVKTLEQNYSHSQY